MRDIRQIGEHSDGGEAVRGGAELMLNIQWQHFLSVKPKKNLFCICMKYLEQKATWTGMHNKGQPFLA